MKSHFAQIPVGDLVEGENIRHELGDLDDLVASVRQHGVLEPLVCCPSDVGDKPEVLFGHRRLEAARRAGLTEVPCLLRPRPPERERILMQLAENFEREDMTELDEALTFQRLIALGLTQMEIAKAVHRSQTHVSHRLRILGLPECVRMAVDLGWLSYTVALQIPDELLRDAHRPGLVKALRSGDEGMRRWIRSCLSPRERHSSGKVPRRQINVRPEVFEIAQDRSKALGVGIGPYVEQLIDRDVRAAQAVPASLCTPCRALNHSNCTERGCACTTSVCARRRQAVHA